MATTLNGSSDRPLPAWKLPLTKSYTSTLKTALGSSSTSNSNSNSNNKEDDYNDSDSKNIFSYCPSKMKGGSVSSTDETSMEDGGDTTVIQILLPCLVCNRTFSPEALERHGKVCTKVNVKTKFTPIRGTWDSSSMRIKNTKVADFIPPPPEPQSDFSIGRSAKGSFRRSKSSGGNNNWQLPGSRSRSVDRSSRATTPAASVIVNYYKKANNFEDEAEEYGSNSNSEKSFEENQSVADSHITQTPTNLPSYARPLNQSETCPICGRNFVLKAFDRHYNFCKDLFIRKQYETQPTPKEKEEARERQEIRTKYKPLKGSNSLQSLRSMSPGRDLSSLALKFFGGLRGSSSRRSDVVPVSTNYFTAANKSRSSFKKSNESLANSCYGDFSRGIRSPTPTQNFQRQQSFNYNYNHPPPSKSSMLPMRVNTSSNIPRKITKSIENLNHFENGNFPEKFSHVQSSGYGPDGHFLRNGRGRSSLHKNFFRRRIEPEGTENTSTSSYCSNNNNSPGNPLLITPMSYFTKTNANSLSSSSNPKMKDGYDPYEKAAKQLEELLKSQPIKPTSNKNTERKFGISRALTSVFGIGKSSSSSSNSPLTLSYNSTSNNNNSNNTTRVDHSDKDPFVVERKDSYWDSILRKNQRVKGEDELLKTKEGVRSGGVGGVGGRGNNSSSEGSSNGNDNNNSLKYRASNESGYHSRSDGTDLEFETLENMVQNLGEVPSRRYPLKSGSSSTSMSTSTPNSYLNSNSNPPAPPPRKKETESQLALSRIEKRHQDEEDGSVSVRKMGHGGIESPLQRLKRTFSNSENGFSNSNTINNSYSNSNSNSNTSSNSNSNFLQNNSSIYSSNPSAGNSGKNTTTNNNIKPTTTSTTSSDNSRELGSNKYCHNCGEPYLSILAKFCSACGKQRMFNY